jgi:hypothetical protein
MTCSPKYATPPLYYACGSQEKMSDVNLAVKKGTTGYALD